MQVIEFFYHQNSTLAIFGENIWRKPVFGCCTLAGSSGCSKAADEADGNEARTEALQASSMAENWKDWNQCVPNKKLD